MSHKVRWKHQQVQVTQSTAAGPVPSKTGISKIGADHQHASHPAPKTLALFPGGTSTKQTSTTQPRPTTHTHCYASTASSSIQTVFVTT
jgi:hypothetical protein